MTDPRPIDDLQHGLPPDRTVLSRARVPASPLDLILVRWEKTPGRQEYVVARHEPGQDGWNWGTYFLEVQPALALFVKRHRETYGFEAANRN